MTGSATPERKLFLDGLRGWAALIVVLYHTLHGFLSTATHTFDGIAFRFVTDGALAVSIFFVLSGFALSVGFFETGDRGAVVMAALRRYPRLTIPILASSLVAWALLSVGLMANRDVAPILNNVGWLGSFYTFPPALDHVMRFALWNVYFDFRGGDVYNAVLWTMATELYGSIMVFALLYTVGDRRWRGPVYGVAAVVLWAHGGPLLAFLFGMALADLFASPGFRRLRGAAWAPAVGTALMVAGVAKSTLLPTDFNDACSMAVVATMVVAGPVVARAVARVFEGALSRALGRLSFPVYLIHLMVLCSLSSWFYGVLYRVGVPVAGNAVATAMLTVVASYAAAVAFEPAERCAVTWSRRMAQALLVVCSECRPALRRAET